MKKNECIFIAGHKGLVGSAVLENLKKTGFKNIITDDRKKLDLRNYNLVDKFFRNKLVNYFVNICTGPRKIRVQRKFSFDIRII